MIQYNRFGVQSMGGLRLETNLEAGVAPVASIGRVEVSLCHLETPDPAL